ESNRIAKELEDKFLSNITLINLIILISIFLIELSFFTILPENSFALLSIFIIPGVSLFLVSKKLKRIYKNVEAVLFLQVIISLVLLVLYGFIIGGIVSGAY
ncbi:hypothetical protein M1316_00515, partial [Candidatus Parvarchaeota archaeon]|nr:hypothetical protein [Candidatus Parvarchaeota archaeon]